MGAGGSCTGDIVQDRCHPSLPSYERLRLQTLRLIRHLGFPASRHAHFQALSSLVPLHLSSRLPAPRAIFAATGQHGDAAGSRSGAGFGPAGPRPRLRPGRGQGAAAAGLSAACTGPLHSYPGKRATLGPCPALFNLQSGPWLQRRCCFPARLHPVNPHGQSHMRSLPQALPPASPTAAAAARRRCTLPSPAIRVRCE